MDDKVIAKILRRCSELKEIREEMWKRAKDREEFFYPEEDDAG